MKQIVFLLGILVLLSSCTPTQKSKQGPEQSEQDQKMAWWREARFGMFIHWGLYAIPAGEWDGERIPGISEWIMANAKIPVKEYEKLAAKFDPEKFDADAWVKLAKEAGMKYIVITSKHHDGFAMYHSLASKYNIVDATPFDRDPLKELADACDKYSIRLGFYYSQAQDWHEPGGTYWNIEQGKPHWDPSLEREPLMNYIDGKAVPQVEELLENYHPAILWWDTPRGMTEEAAEKLKAVTDKYPELITNDRLYGPWKGDFTTPEQHVPPTGLDYDWEVCMTMNTSWGYKYYDNNWKSPQTIIRMLVDIASKGGNLLLNVGPDSYGQIPDSSVVILKTVGEWMKKNGESIYGTTASPFFKLPWGRCTKRVNEKGTTLYFHVFDWPQKQILRVPKFTSRIKDIYLVSNPNQKFAFRFEDENLLIHAPNVTFDAINTVIAVEVRGKLKIESNKPGLVDGKIILPADFADIHNPGYGEHARIEGSEKQAIIRNWIDKRTRLEWFFDTNQAGNYNVQAFLRSKEKNNLKLEIDGQTYSYSLGTSGNEFKLVDLGDIEIKESGGQILTLTPGDGEWKGIELSSIILSLK